MPYLKMNKPIIRISQSLQAQIQRLHFHCSVNEEWSGILVYKIISGSIEDPGTLEISAEGVFPMDYGTSGYTEYDSSAVILDMLDIYSGLDPIEGDPSVWRTGHIHSHHNMTTNFSGTDDSELKTNAKQFPFYLSLIVNYDLRYNAKIAIPVTQTKRTLTILSSKSVKQRRRNVVVENTETIEALECFVDLGPGLPPVDDWFTNRLEVIKNEKAAKTTYKYNNTIPSSGYNSKSVTPPPNGYSSVINRLSELMSLGLSEHATPYFVFKSCSSALTLPMVEKYVDAISIYFRVWRMDGWLANMDDEDIIDCITFFVSKQTNDSWFVDTVWKGRVIPKLKEISGLTKEKQVQGPAVV